MQHKIIDIIKNNTAKFFYYRKGLLYYSINVDCYTYIFPVPIDDTGDATFNVEDKASLFLRWLRKSDTDGTLQCIKQSITP